MGKRLSKNLACSEIENDTTPYFRTSSYNECLSHLDSGRLSVNQDSLLSIPTSSLSNEDVRNRFLHRMTSVGVWGKENKSKGQSIIVFDWDNTLLCTSYLSAKAKADEPLDKKTLYRLSLIERMAFRLLKFAISLGKTYIVTNASKEWVEFSAKTWAPKLLELFDKLTIVSARIKHERRYLWKKKTFLQLKENYDTGKIINLVSIGDSTFERDAARLFGQYFLDRHFPHRCIKTIKFQRMPSPRDLYKQLTIVNDRLQSIFDSGKSLTINLRP